MAVTVTETPAAPTGASVGGGIGGAIGGLLGRLTAKDIEGIPREVVALLQDIMNRPALYDTQEFDPVMEQLLGEAETYLGESPYAGLRPTEWGADPGLERGIRRGLGGLEQLASRGITQAQQDAMGRHQLGLQAQQTRNISALDRSQQARGVRSAASGVAAQQMAAQNMAGLGAGAASGMAGLVAQQQGAATMALPGAYGQATSQKAQRDALAAQMRDRFAMQVAGGQQQHQLAQGQAELQGSLFDIGNKHGQQQRNIGARQQELVRGQSIRNRASESQYNQRVNAARNWTQAQNELNRVIQAQNAADAEMFGGLGEAAGTAVGFGLA